MRTFLTVCLFVSLSSWAQCSDLAIQNTRESIQLLQSDLAAAEQSDAVSLQSMQERRLELIEARILLAELEHKPDAVTPLLKEIVELWSVAEARSMDLVKVGAVSAAGLLDVQRQSLAAQVRLAQHTGDRVALRKLSTKWVELETQQLERLKHLVTEGLASQSELARQKIRIARAGRVAEL